MGRNSGQAFASCLNGQCCRELKIFDKTTTNYRLYLHASLMTRIIILPIPVPDECCRSQVTASDDGNTSAVLQRIGLPADRHGSDHHGNVSSPYVVPNIVHYIWFAKDDNKQLSFINYVSVVSAHRIQKPDTIMLHCNHLPAGEWWDRLWKEVYRLIIACASLTP